MNNKVMAEKLRKLRGNRSRQEVAEACGISWPVISTAPWKLFFLHSK